MRGLEEQNQTATLFYRKDFSFAVPQVREAKNEVEVGERLKAIVTALTWSRVAEKVRCSLVDEMMRALRFCAVRDQYRYIWIRD